MYKEYLEDFIINENETVYKAGWQMQRNRTLLLVVDDNNKFMGIVAEKEIQKSFFNKKIYYVKEICNSNCTRIVCDPDNDFYAEGRNIFAEKNISFIPVIDKENNIIDLFSRERAFFLQSYNARKLKRMHYAESIFKMADEVKQFKGEIPGFSVIEFGVAGGNGLVAAEYYAREISRLTDIKIDVYGFDNAAGLPEIKDYRKEAGYMWFGGLFNIMDVEQTKKRLRSAKLILGDIEESLKTFIEEYHPLPIGVIFVDVDHYASTCPILSFLEREDELFTPRVRMYFDDIVNDTDSIGEDLAVREFNARNSDIKILPEGSRTKIKTCSRYLHPLYNKPFERGYDFTGCNYSFYLI